MFRSILTDRLQSAFRAAEVDVPSDFDVAVVLAADTRFGDYQSNAAMMLARQLKTNPRQLAEKVKAHLDMGDLCEKVSIDGPGFLNFTLSRQALAANLSRLLTDERLSVPQVRNPRTIVVDFSAPNIAKPMHVGHIRSTIIGDCLARVAKFVGHRVITDNHLGDWGTQFGMILHGWKTMLDAEALAQDPIHELLRIYKAVTAKTKSDDATLAACREELVKLQQGDLDNLAIWKQCVDLSLRQLRSIYAKLDVHFDHFLGESFYNDKLGPLVEQLLTAGIAEVSEGAVCIFFRDIPELADKPCLIRKSDGGYLYATTDLATIDHRIHKWKADEIWYVVGAPQALHFQQLFAATKKRGQTVRMSHVAFGSILGPDGKMFKTRSGESVGLIEVLDEAVHRATEKTDDVGRKYRLFKAIEDSQETLGLQKRDLNVPKQMSEDEAREAAEAIGIGAVKYAELSQNRMTDYKFSWEKMLSLQGNTAPYLINAYVRTRSIFRKLASKTAAELSSTPPASELDRIADMAPGGIETHEFGEDVVIAEDAERALAVKLAQFAETTHDVLQDYRPNLLAQYLYELATTYHAFYEACPVLRAVGAARNTRLMLCEATSRVLKQGLSLLGIKTTERM